MALTRGALNPMVLSSRPCTPLGVVALPPLLLEEGMRAREEDFCAGRRICKEGTANEEQAA